MVHDVEQALAEARAARNLGADLVEFRLDEFFHGGDRGFDASAGEGHSGPDTPAGVLPSLDTLEAQIDAVCDLVTRSPAACIATCRPTWEGGFYDGPEDARIALFEALGTLAPPRGHPPRYIDLELAAYARSANIRQKVHLAVDHPHRARDLAPSLILSIHDFSGPPADLSRRLLAARTSDAARVIKVAVHARSLRDNLELFDILSDRDRPTVALGMGEFGLMSRVLAPKFGGFLTFASLRRSATTAPGQPTIAELVGTYRFRSITPRTRVYGIVGWPIGHSLSPQVHNSGFEAVGHDGVYLPLPIAANAMTARDEPNETSGGRTGVRAGFALDEPAMPPAVEVETGRPGRNFGHGAGGRAPTESPGTPDVAYVSFKATLLALIDHARLDFSGCSVTIPHKQNLVRLAREQGWAMDPLTRVCGAANTLVVDREIGGAARACRVMNTDAVAAHQCLEEAVGELSGLTVGVIGAGGVARSVAAACALAGARVTVFARRLEQARTLVDDLIASLAAEQNMDRPNSRGSTAERHPGNAARWRETLTAADLEDTKLALPQVVVNATPVGMQGGPRPGASPIPLAIVGRADGTTVFFDTVYRPLETPMLAAARAAGCRVVNGLQMFTRQAAEQFRAWTDQEAPVGLLDRVASESMGET